MTLLAPLTSNKAFNERYRQNYVSGTKSPILKRSHVPNCDGSTTDIAATAATGNKRFNPLMMPAVDPFADTPPLKAAPKPIISDGIPVLRLDDVSVSAPVVAAPSKNK